MEAIRKIITADSQTLHILLPENLVHKELEVIILPLKDQEKSETEKTATYRSQRGKISKAEAEKMLAYVEASRKEWR